MTAPARIEHFRELHSGYPLGCKQSYRAAAWSALQTARMWQARGDTRWTLHWMQRLRRARALALSAKWGKPGLSYLGASRFDAQAPMLGSRELGVGSYSGGLHA
ncbi:hypothetical protein [Marinicauda sp. Alg238-R41]|uniref:hypothetical protein n=1 Tax=Marinicauda sp. Alg238-R41 TaxID=2993447 RepID=UPI0022E35931|nr:hypothetical protein [Marinicauda sp. Alg238-R41]